MKEAENYAVFKEFMYVKRKNDEDMLTYVSRFCGSKVKAEIFEYLTALETNFDLVNEQDTV